MTPRGRFELRPDVLPPLRATGFIQTSCAPFRHTASSLRSSDCVPKTPRGRFELPQDGPARSLLSLAGCVLRSSNSPFSVSSYGLLASLVASYDEKRRGGDLNSRVLSDTCSRGRRLGRARLPRLAADYRASLFSGFDFRGRHWPDLRGRSDPRDGLEMPRDGDGGASVMTPGDPCVTPGVASRVLRPRSSR